MDQMISVDPTIFYCPTKQELLDESDTIAGHLSSRGYVIVQAWDAECATVTEVAECFGRVQSHIRADANGIVGISPDTAVNHDWENYRSEYHGVSSEEFAPHTDGSYLHGLVRHGDDYVRLMPPQMLVLQCRQPATSGGANVLIDVQQIFDDLAESNPLLLDTLSIKGCVSYCRDDQIALDCAVFEELDDGTVMLRFRYDSTAYVAGWARDAFHTLQRDYFSDPRYQDRVTLKQGQIAIIDNYRMLHGRDSFAADEPGKTRSMRRVWLARGRLPVLRNAADQHVERRALKRFQAYSILPPSPEYAASERPLLGIRLPA